jgi:hypothetical protein
MGGVLFDKDGTTLIQYPNGKIGLTYQIPYGVNSIGKHAFIECNLTSVTIPGSVTSIGDWAFCFSHLTRLTIPDSVTSIGELAFCETPLTSLSIGSGVTSIGRAAFADCIYLTGAYFYGNAPATFGADVFAETAPGFNIYYINGWPDWTNPWHGYPTAKWAGLQAIADFVTRFYQLCLLRDPDTGGLNYWVDLLVTGQQTGAGISQGFILSNEFITRNASDSDFLDIMYMTFFNRAADSGGKAYWQSQLDSGMSRQFILANFVNSNEFSSVCNSYGITRGSIQLTEPADLNPQVTAFVNRFYQLCLDRDPDSGGLNYWVDLLVTKQSTGANLAQGFVFSSEFAAKGLSNTDFIAVMYRAFFDREPDGGGQAYWVGLLETGMSRLQVLAGFVGSQEFAALCSSIGIEVGVVNY